jgi:hypothetical protein
MLKTQKLPPRPAWQTWRGQDTQLRPGRAVVSVATLPTFVLILGHGCCHVTSLAPSDFSFVLLIAPLTRLYNRHIRHASHPH